MRRNQAIRLSGRSARTIEYENVLNSKLSVGEGADIFYIRSGVTINKYQPEKYMLDMSDQEWVSRYTDWAKEGVSNDGKIVQFQTWSVDGWGILQQGHF